MKANSNTPPTPAAKRKRVQLALDNFVNSCANDDDLAVFRDRRFTYCATAEQACRFIEAATGRSVPFDIYVTWSNILRHRYLVGRHMRLKRQPMQMPTVPMQVPAVHLEEEEDA
jgi:hypothetical protein